MIKEHINKFTKKIKYFRLTPFDTSTIAGEEAERHRRIAISAVSGGLSQAINYSVMLIMVPLLLKYLGKEQYGLWLAISSMASFAVFSDFGLGNGLINVLGKAHGLSDKTMAKQAVSSAYTAMIAISAIILVIGVPAILHVDWNAFFKITDPLTANLTQKAILTYFLFFVINIALSLTMKIRMAYQEAYINNIFLAITKLLMLVGCIVGTYTGRGLLYFITILAGTQCLASITNAIFLFSKSRPWLFPSISNIDKNVSITLLKTGLFFYIVGISTVLATQIDSLVIAKFLGAELVPSYSIPLKLFMIVNTLLAFMLMPIWPAYREALVKKRLEWVKKTFFRTLTLMITLNIIPLLILVLFTPKIIMIWTGTSLDVPLSLLVAMSLSVMLAAIIGPVAMLLNGANINLGTRAALIIVNGLMNLTLSIYLVNKIGISGPVWGTVITQLCISMPTSIYFTRKIFKGQYEGNTQTN
jgi:O-antigen/teichoic acid export membrane protein